MNGVHVIGENFLFIYVAGSSGITVPYKHQNMAKIWRISLKKVKKNLQNLQSNVHSQKVVKMAKTGQKWSKMA